MAKRRSSEYGKAKSKTTKPPKSPPVPAAGEMLAPKTAKMPRGLRKQLRRLERKLSDAAQRERKRVRKLERAYQQRQAIEAALVELRASAPTKPKGPAKAAPAAAAATGTPAKTTVVGPAKGPVRARSRTAAPARPRAARPAASPRRTAPKPPPAGPTASPSDPAKP
jgi:hypothetical protein